MSNNDEKFVEKDLLEVLTFCALFYCFDELQSVSGHLSILRSHHDSKANWYRNEHQTLLLLLGLQCHSQDRIVGRQRLLRILYDCMHVWQLVIALDGYHNDMFGIYSTLLL